MESLINHSIRKQMKKILILLCFSLCMVSCYDDYIKDNEYDSVCFPFQNNVRTFVVGEGMHLKVGVVLGGPMENTRERTVGFKLDNSLITRTVLEDMKLGLPYIKDAVADVDQLHPMPTNYYMLSDAGKMIIKAGMHTGTVTVTADSAAFLADPDVLQAKYVLPFLITSADADSIIYAKKSAVIGFRYDNMLFGNYYHGGVTTIKDNATGAVTKTVKYYTAIPQPDKDVWSLKTVAPNALVTSGISNTGGSFKITLDGNNIIVSKADGSTVDVQPDGTSTFNRPKLLQDRKLILSYKYDNGDGTTSFAQDTLTFRNRIRDGVNEWQDENPAHYQ